MESEFETTLAQVAQEVFSSMAFIMPAEEEEAATEDDAAPVVAQVLFSGPFAGSLVLSVSGNMLPTLAANIMGLEDAGSTSLEQQQDALKELLNVTCGNLLPLVGAASDVFHVCEPHILEDIEHLEAFQGIAPQARAKLRLDCGEADLTLFVIHSSEVPAA
jgi:CheY-specific phosphatase CheX